MRITPAHLLPLLFLASPAFAQSELSDTDRLAAFEAAGFERIGDQWQACEDPGTESYTAGSIDEVRDLNKDGLLEAMITEGSIFCFGSTEVGYSLVSKQTDGSWKLIAAGPGVPTVLDTTGEGAGLTWESVVPASVSRSRDGTAANTSFTAASTRGVLVA
jgi:hypothetical protein